MKKVELNFDYYFGRRYDSSVWELVSIATENNFCETRDCSIDGRMVSGAGNYCD